MEYELNAFPVWSHLIHKVDPTISSLHSGQFKTFRLQLLSVCVGIYFEVYQSSILHVTCLTKAEEMKMFFLFQCKIGLVPFLSYKGMSFRCENKQG